MPQPLHWAKRKVSQVPPHPPPPEVGGGTSARSLGRAPSRGARRVAPRRTRRWTCSVPGRRAGGRWVAPGELYKVCDSCAVAQLPLKSWRSRAPPFRRKGLDFYQSPYCTSCVCSRSVSQLSVRDTCAVVFLGQGLRAGKAYSCCVMPAPSTGSLGVFVEWRMTSRDLPELKSLLILDILFWNISWLHFNHCLIKRYVGETLHFNILQLLPLCKFYCLINSTSH